MIEKIGRMYLTIIFYIPRNCAGIFSTYKLNYIPTWIDLKIVNLFSDRQAYLCHIGAFNNFECYIIRIKFRILAEKFREFLNTSKLHDMMYVSS